MLNSALLSFYLGPSQDLLNNERGGGLLCCYCIAYIKLYERMKFLLLSMAASIYLSPLFKYCRPRIHWRSYSDPLWAKHVCAG